ncbi:Ceramide glucosyltransferase [Mycoemilia scoparia]|uniref:Ceramide glucosyltransferase n=1 Tax=Mycoemilia scoparia TaxID=417184 RepID=A0A9W8A5I3_9FUNG|nr:Ceramide glucosyltransferase [Mycoemilia scoparia]
MKRTLEASFTQDYPKYEILFAVEDPDDPSIEIANELIEKYPKVDAKVLIARNDVGVNPKVNNLVNPMKQAKYDMLWVCDSNIYSKPHTLRLSVDAFLDDPKVGVAHHVVFCENPQTFGGLLDTTFLNTTHARMYIAINTVAIASCLMGKSNIYRKSSLEKHGGIKNFGKYMAEDNIIGQKLWKDGWRHIMTGDLAYQPSDTKSLYDYCVRRARWVRTRKYNVTAATLIEPLTESILLGIVAAYSLNSLFGFDPYKFFMVHILGWFLNDYVVFVRLSRGRNTEKFGQFVLGWLGREILALPLWIYAIVGNQVSWRGQKFYLHMDGTVSKIN